MDYLEHLVTTRIVIEVVAGIIPEQPMEEYTTRYSISSEEWYADDADHVQLLTRANGAASAYAQWLMLQPDRVNWVRLDWLYL